jgi:arylsulfatase
MIEQTNASGRAISQPNIVLILADDMGYADIGCYGSEIRTPNLDALAGNGVRFSQMYNCARCCPTRASLLTGLYPHQAGVGHMVNDRGVGPAYQGYLRQDCVTMAEALKLAGYRTYLSGKWHVGGGYSAHRPDSWTPGAVTPPMPIQRGFDPHSGLRGGAASYFHPTAMVENDTIIPPGDFGNDYYLTDAISARACGMIDDAVDHPAPFFLYVAYTAPHWPLHAWEEDIARYQGRYHRDGWDAVRTARHEQLKASGILDAAWPISPRDQKSRPWEDVQDKDWEDRRMAVYAAQVDRMDQGIGRILGKLREHGLGDDTIIVFLSDNGGCA